MMKKQLSLRIHRFSACDEAIDEAHEHVYGDWETANPASCDAAGKQKREDTA